MEKMTIDDVYKIMIKYNPKTQTQKFEFLHTSHPGSYKGFETVTYPQLLPTLHELRANEKAMRECMREVRRRAWKYGIRIHYTRV